MLRRHRMKTYWVIRRRSALHIVAADTILADGDTVEFEGSYRECYDYRNHGIIFDLK
jgi:methylthioribose-1-phosphate isomerase